MSSSADFLQGLQQNFQLAVMTRAEHSALLRAGHSAGGFNIYANAYQARLVAALRDNYPMLYLALGDDMFDALAAAYVELRPSSFRSIRWFGDGLAEFMDDHQERIPHPALSDLATMDWALRESFDAADDDRLTVDDLAQLAPEAWATQRFQLRAAVVLRDLDWNIEPVWQALNEDATAETSPPEPLQHTLLVWRNKLDCKWRSLEGPEAVGLKALGDGKGFAAICESILAIDDTITPTDAALMLRQWVEHGLLASVRAS